MRPKKVVLIADPDEDRAGQLRFVLEVQGFRAIHAAKPPAVQALAPTADVVLIRCATIPEGDVQAERIKAMLPRKPVLLAADLFEGLCVHADGCLDAKISAADLVERLRFMAKGRRGPAPSILRKMKPEPAELSA